jgi:hypothetical protein
VEVSSLEPSLNLESVLSAFFSFCLRPSIMSYAPLCFSHNKALLHHAQQKEQQQQQNKEAAATTTQAVPPPAPLLEDAESFIRSAFRKATRDAKDMGLVDYLGNDEGNAIDELEREWLQLK